MPPLSQGREFMKYNKTIAKKWKLMMLCGPPLAFLGLMIIPYVLIADTYPRTEELMGLAILLIFTGIVTTWIGKIGVFWFYR